MKSETLLQYLGYFAISVFCVYFVMVVLKVNSDFIYSSSFDHMGFGSPIIEGLEVSAPEKKLYEKAGENVDIVIAQYDKDARKKRQEYLDTVPSDAKESIVDLYELMMEDTAGQQAEALCRKLKESANHKQKGTKFIFSMDTILRTIRKDYPYAVEKKMMEKLGKKD
jgi:hypothetical protein